MSQDLAQLVQATFVAGDRLFLAPDIPPSKLSGALAQHRAAVGTAPVLVLYDDTLLGGAEDGFLVTAGGLYWKNLLEPARCLGWEDFVASEVAVSSDGVSVGRAQITVVDRAVRAPLRSLLVAMARGQAGPPTRLDVPSLVRISLKYLGTPQEVFLAPSIPARKLRTIQDTHGLAPEDVAVVYDDTLFGSAENGFVLTCQGISWKNLTEPPVHVRWDALDVAAVEVVRGGVGLPQGRIDIALVGRVGQGIVDLLRAASWLAAHGVLPAPPAEPAAPGAERAVRCPYCRVRVASEERFCPACGAPQ